MSQYRPAYNPANLEASHAFDSEGVCERLDGPTPQQQSILAEREQTIAWFLRVLFCDASSIEQVGRRAAVFAYVTRFQDAPAKSIRDLAKLFNVSPTRAAQICTTMREIILEMPRD